MSEQLQYSSVLWLENVLTLTMAQCAILPASSVHLVVEVCKARQKSQTPFISILKKAELYGLPVNKNG